MSAQRNQSSPSFTTYLLGFLAVLGFGGTLPFTTLALTDFNPEFLTCFRALIAAALAAITLTILRKPLRHKDDFLIFIAGILLVFAFPGMMAIAMQTVPASHGGVILGFMPLATALFSRLYTGETSSPVFWVLSITGALIIAAFTIYTSDDQGAGGVSSGDLWLIAAGLSSAFGYVLFGKLSRSTPGWEIISRSLILNLPLILSGTIWFYEPRFLSPSTQGLIGLFYVGGISMFLGFCAWNMALARGSIAKIGQIQLLQTFITIIIAAILLNERIDSLTVITAIAITGIIVLSRKV